MSKSKIPYEKKVEIARDYLEGRVGYKESLGRANNSGGLQEDLKYITKTHQELRCMSQYFREMASDMR